MGSAYEDKVLIAYLQIKKENERYLRGDKSAYTTVIKHTDSPYAVIDAIHKFYDVDYHAKDALYDALIRLIQSMKTVQDATTIFMCIDCETTREYSNEAAFKLGTDALKKIFVNKIDSDYKVLIHNDIGIMGFRNRIKELWGM
jgi:hypothetical protein